MRCRRCEVAGYLAEDGWPAAKALMWHQQCKGHDCDCGCRRRVHEPHFGVTRLGQAVHRRAVDHLPAATGMQRFNKRAATGITTAVGTMWCAYAFAVLALLSLPAILTQAFSLHVFPTWLISASLITLVAWLSSYFLQLVLLPVIIVGQNVQAEASDARAAKTFEDAELIADLLNLETMGGLAAVMSEIKDAKIAAETAREAVKMLTAILAPKTPMTRKATRKEPS